MPFVNYQKRPLVFNEMGKPINDLSMKDAIKEANLDYKVGIKETRVRLEDPANPGSFLLYKVPNSSIVDETLLQIPSDYITENNTVNKVSGSNTKEIQVVVSSVD